MVISNKCDTSLGVTCMRSFGEKKQRETLADQREPFVIAIDIVKSLSVVFSNLGFAT